MTKRSVKTGLKLPPQLIGVHLDALRTNAVAFKIERFPSLVMASCSSQNQAMEIDFEIGAGQEMIDYIVAQGGIRNGKGGFLLEYEGNRFNCTVATDGQKTPAWVEVSWQTASAESRPNQMHDIAAKRGSS
jgi:hypothetical protein